MMKSLKKSRDDILVFLERSYVVPHSCKVSYSGLNWIRSYDGGRDFCPPGYLMLKKPRLVWVNLEKLADSNLQTSNF